LVFSELYPTAVKLSPSGYWQWGSYFELYNNSDSRVDLANLLFVDAVVIGVDSPNFPCSNYVDIQRDPSGVWADFVYRFPKDVAPLVPGERIVVATDAIDHRQFGTGIGFHDLSDAQYEFRGSSDTDNPLARDVVSVGPRVEPFGHGWFGFALRNLIALAAPLDLDTLPHQSHPAYAAGTPLVRIPTAALIDVLQWNTTLDHDYPYCPPSVVSEIDAGEPRIINAEDTLSMHRRIRYTLPDGRPVLQKSRNSAADWIVAPGTPHQIP
jgi:hypothetical protein